MLDDMKKRMGLSLIFFLLIMPLVSADCSLFCQAGQWWDGLFLKEEALAGKAGEGVHSVTETLVVPVGTEVERFEIAGTPFYLLEYEGSYYYYKTTTNFNQGYAQEVTYSQYASTDWRRNTETITLSGFLSLRVWPLQVTIAPFQSAGKIEVPVGTDIYLPDEDQSKQFLFALQDLVYLFVTKYYYTDGKSVAEIPKEDYDLAVALSIEGGLFRKEVLNEKKTVGQEKVSASAVAPASSRVISPGSVNIVAPAQSTDGSALPSSVDCHSESIIPIPYPSAGALWIPPNICGQEVDLLITLHGYTNTIPSDKNFFLEIVDADELVQIEMGRESITPVIIAAPMDGKAQNTPVFQATDFNINDYISRIEDELRPSGITIRTVSLLGFSDALCDGGLLRAAQQLELYPLYFIGAADGTCKNEYVSGLIKVAKEKKAFLWHMHRGDKKGDDLSAEAISQEIGETNDIPSVDPFSSIKMSDDRRFVTYQLTEGSRNHDEVPAELLQEALPYFFGSEAQPLLVIAAATTPPSEESSTPAAAKPRKSADFTYCTSETCKEIDEVWQVLRGALVSSGDAATKVWDPLTKQWLSFEIVHQPKEVVEEGQISADVVGWYNSFLSGINYPGSKREAGAAEGSRITTEGPLIGFDVKASDKLASKELIEALNAFRNKVLEFGYNKQIVITSLTRDSTETGASQHTSGNAADIKTDGLSLKNRLIFIRAAIEAGFTEVLHGTSEGTNGLSEAENQYLRCFWYNEHHDHLHLALGEGNRKLQWETCIKAWPKGKTPHDDSKKNVNS